LLDTKVKKNIQKFGKYFWGIKNCFFRASCFGFRVKGVCPLLLPLVSLIQTDVCNQIINGKTNKFFLAAWFSDLPAINATVFSTKKGGL
jgi:hypothetical protein